MDLSTPFAAGANTGIGLLPQDADSHPDHFDDVDVALPPAWSGPLPADREQMLACVTRLCQREERGNLPRRLAGLARELGGPALPLQRLHDLVQALHSCGAGNEFVQARWPEAMQALADALGGPSLCEDHRDSLVRLAALPAGMRKRPAWLLFEALARSLGGTLMEPRHCIGLALALRQDEYLADPQNLAALFNVLGSLPGSAFEAARQRESLHALVAALAPCDCDPEGPILLAGAMNFIHPCPDGTSSIFAMSAPAVEALAQALIERLACEHQISAQEGHLHWFAVSLGRLAHGAANGREILARAYARLAQAAADIPAGRLGMVVLDLTEHACPRDALQGLGNPVVAEAVAKALGPSVRMPAAQRLAWLRSIAQLALPASGWVDPVAQTDRLAPLAQGMLLAGGAPLRAPVLALAAMALVSPWVPDEVIEGTDVQERPLLTCIALSARAGLPALTAMAMGAARGLGLQDDPKSPARIRAAVEWLVDAGVPPAVAEAIGNGLQLAIEPARLLDGERCGLALDDDERQDWLEAAHLCPRHAMASRLAPAAGTDGMDGIYALVNGTGSAIDSVLTPASALAAATTH